jgi:hypothetical protein
VAASSLALDASASLISLAAALALLFLADLAA